MGFELIKHPCVREAAHRCAASRTFAKSAGSASSLRTIMRGGLTVCVLFFYGCLWLSRLLLCVPAGGFKKELGAFKNIKPSGLFCKEIINVSAQADCESAFRGELCSPGFRISLRAAAQPITLTPVQTRLADRQGEYGAPLRSTPD